MSDSPQTLTDLAGQINAKREEDLSKRAAEPRRAYLPRSSNIPECARQGVYEIVAYNQRKPFDIHLIARFEEGDRQEAWVMAELSNIGAELKPKFRLVETQSDLPKEFIDKYRLTGHLDGKIEFSARRVPFEIKSLNPNLWDNIQMVSDLIADPFYSRYYRQMLAYMKASGETECLLITTDCLGHWRFIIVPFSETDFEEMVVKKVNTINDYVKRNEGKADNWDLPERIPYSEDHCARCPFIHICVPDVTSGARVRFADDEKMAAMIDRRQEIEPFAKEFKAVDEALKDDLKLLKEPMLVVGNWIVEGKPQKGKKVVVPPTDPVKLKEFTAAEKLLESFEAPGPDSWRFKFTRQGGESPAKLTPAEAAQGTPVPSPASPVADASPVSVLTPVASEPVGKSPASVESAPVRPKTPLGWSELPLSPVKSVTLQAEASNTRIPATDSHGGTGVAANGGGAAEPVLKFSTELGAAVEAGCEDKKFVLAVDGADLKRAVGIPSKRPKIKI